MPRVFVVEDDENIRELVVYALGSAGFDAVGFADGGGLFDELGGVVPALVLLDIMLPGIDGLAVLKRLRADPRYKALPVILLTAKTAELDRVRGLDMGADDYISKPFSVMELIARVNAVLRRSAAPQAGTLTYGELTLDPERHTVTAGDTKVVLTYKEYELLHYLLLNAELVLSRDRIMDAVWGFDFEGESRTVDMHIKSLRQKLGAAGSYIRTVRGVGYKIGE